MPTDGKWGILGVSFSLLLNVFLLGIIAGHVFSEHRAQPKAPGILVPQAHIRALPDDERRRFVAAMDGHRAVIRAARVKHRAARIAAETDIAAPEFDRAKIEADLEALRQSNYEVQQGVNAGLLDALADLSPASRAALVAHGLKSKSP